MMLHIYYGNGKGKTTAAAGLAVRAAGAGMKVLFLQFLKDGNSSEINVLENINNISVDYSRDCRKFIFQMNESEKNKVLNQHNSMLDRAAESIENNNADMIVLDEILDAYELGIIDRQRASKLIFENKDNIELILTGREPSEKIMQIADYLVEMVSHKHPYDKGIKARKGIEY